MPARGDLTMESLAEETNVSSGSECTGLSEDEDLIINHHSNKCRVSTPTVKEANDNHERFESLPIRSVHETFLRNCIEEILNSAVFSATDRANKVVEFKNPEILSNILDLKLKSNSDSDEKLLQLLKDTIKYSVKTGHPYFVNQLFSGVDPYALAGQWLTDALNPSVYTYEVSPVFTLMEEVVLEEMRKIVGYENGVGDGLFVPGGSIANGYAISCARYKYMPDAKSKGLCNLPRLVMFTSEDSHYSVQKLASFMGIGSDNVYKIKTDMRGKLRVDHLEMEIERVKTEGNAIPFMVSATAGTTVLGAFDPLDDIADLCKKHNLWMHVDAAWGGGALMSQKYRALLKGIERSDSVTWNPHKLLAAPQQCSTFLTRHQGILSPCHSTNATYLFQKDKFYDTKYDTGDKHIQCGRRADVLKFWFMWRAKGTIGFEAHIDRVFGNAEYFTQQIKQRKDFEMVLDQPECTNICFWYIPPSLQNVPRDDDFRGRIHRVAPKIKERMMKEGTMMMTYQPLKEKPNFFRLVLQNSALNKDDMLHIIDEIERLGCDL
ncbi:acidic amino acid decarboxylase GADL1 [Bradysia coprophila]|uniref:acidic amino acid decarboxylase GADL1 n=1 Tax=Bradysia coprophila TaxID=38358 RepID=UPI00187DC1E9|nr:acidic amino acid decarboxylase GADL1 [Bradysia coprophila]